MVEKKAIPLKEALASKLKSRNLEIDRCIAYIKDSNIKIGWDMEVSRIVADNIVVAELSDEIQHSFVSEYQLVQPLSDTKILVDITDLIYLVIIIIFLKY